MQNTILVVDRDAQTQLLLFRILAEAGYAVTAASDGAEAVAKMEADPPALVMANVECPGKSGVELAHYAKARPVPIPVILVARETNPGPIEPADAVVGTPLDAPKIVDAVRRLLGPEEGRQPHVQERVLVIDDDLAILNLLETILVGEGFAVVTADCGRDGLAALQRERPDLVLLDVQMPGLNGFEVLTRIREIRQDVPVIMVTAYGSEDVAADALRLGADDYMAKPLRVQNLCFRIQRNLEKARLRASQDLLNRQLRQTTLELTERLQGAVQANAAAHALLQRILERLDRRLASEGATAGFAGLVERLRALAQSDDPGAAFAAIAEAIEESGAP